MVKNFSFKIMSKEYAVEGAICMCKFGTTPGRLKVTDNNLLYMNGKLTATTLTLGNVFQPPGFGACNAGFPSRPCVPNVVQWSGFYDGMRVNGNTFPLTDSSKGTCVLGCPACIDFQTSGQIPIPGLPQIQNASLEHQFDIDPLGANLGLLMQLAEEEEIVAPNFFDVDAAIAHLNARAHAISQRRCGRYVREALEAGGFFRTQGLESAHEWADYLLGRGLPTVAFDDNYSPRVGDIAVFGAIQGHQDGHIQMWNGQEWVSDYRQDRGNNNNGFWSSQNYRNAHANGEGRITIFRQ